jgi:hypothetical protein
VTVLMVLAGIVVIASLIPLPAYSISGGGRGPAPRHCGDHRRAAGGGRDGGYRPVTKALAPGQPGTCPAPGRPHLFPANPRLIPGDAGG